MLLRDMPVPEARRNAGVALIARREEPAKFCWHSALGVSSRGTALAGFKGSTYRARFCAIGANAAGLPLHSTNEPSR